MELIILGSGTCVPSLKRGGPGLLIKIEGDLLLFDMGLGTLHTMLRLNINHRDIDTLYLSHFHPDHITELIPFLFACNWGGIPREKPLDIVGGKGVKAFVEKLNMANNNYLEPKNYIVTFFESPDCPEKHYSITTKPMKHKEESIGFRIEDKKGKSIVYSGDTDYCDEIIELACGCDVLVLESSFPDELKTEGHLTPALASKIAMLSHCKKLILTHLYPECDRIDIKQQAHRYYKSDIIIGHDCMRFEI
ncbi:MAG: MBL fold metallo-hydrolase [bacterium]